MKLLVATRLTQGQRKNDFAFTRDGEIVYQGSRCTLGDADDACGCRRSLTGAETKKSTTTMEVLSDPSFTQEQWVQTVAESLRNGGWYRSIASARPSAKKLLRQMQTSIKPFKPGSIVELRDDELVLRAIAK